MTLHPLNDRILVQVDPPEAKLGNIILTDEGKKAQTTGTVVAVGPGKFSDMGVRVPMQLKVGDRIVFKPYGVDPIADVEGGKLMMSEANVVALLLDKPTDVWTADTMDSPADKPKEKGVVQEQAPIPGNHPLAQKSDMDESLARYAARMGTL